MVRSRPKYQDVVEFNPRLCNLEESESLLRELLIIGEEFFDSKLPKKSKHKQDRRIHPIGNDYVRAKAAFFMATIGSISVYDSNMQRMRMISYNRVHMSLKVQIVPNTHHTAAFMLQMHRILVDTSIA